MVKLLLYVHDPDVGKKYLDAISLGDVKCEVINSFETFYAQETKNSYSGFLLDIISSIRATQFDREAIKDLMEVYPSLRLRWDPGCGDIRTLMTGAGAGQKISIDQFITSYCHSFDPRALRLHYRKEINCNVLCSAYGEMPDGSTERTVTLDLSVGGCFFYSTHRRVKGSLLFLRFLELVDDTPIKVEVQWCREWGKSMKVPGVGVRFVDIQSGQMEELTAMINGDSSV